MECKKCLKSLEYCKSITIGKYPICNLCKFCKVCAKKEYNSSNLCSKCCTTCLNCDKLLVKNNWPLDIIINGKCERCNKTCIECERVFMINKLFYDSDEKVVYCDNCFISKFSPMNKEAKFKPIYQRVDLGKQLLRWKKTKIKDKCSECQKSFWKSNAKKIKQTKCKKCKNKNKDQTSSPKDPSNDNIKYELEKKNGKHKWVIFSKKRKCVNCFSSIWINIDNLRDDKPYYCDRCKPTRNDENKKYKYDKKKQDWILYRQRIVCQDCNKKKWIYTKTNKFKCRKCKSKSNA